MHACMHASIHASIHTWIHTYIHYISLHCIALHYIALHCITYRHTYIHTWSYMYTVGYIYILLFYCIYIYIYTYVCFFLLPISSSRVVREKTTYKLFTPERLERHPFRHVWLEEGTPFHWFIIMFPYEKKHLQLAESVEFSWKPPYPFRSFPYFSIVGSGGGTPSFSALRSSWNLGHPRPLGGRGVLDPGNVVKGRSFLLRKNTPCSTEWIYYIYIYISYHTYRYIIYNIT